MNLLNSVPMRYVGTHSYLKSLRHILISYAIFLCCLAFFGKGYDPLTSLMLALLSCGLAIIYMMNATQSIVFKKVDYLLVFLIFVVEASVGIFHFQYVINPNYFSTPIQGISLNDGTYYFDIVYFVYLIDAIAEFRLEEGYFSFSPLESAINKNYILAFLISDIFYFGDAYLLNFMAINILAVFFSGVILALIADKLFGYLDIDKRRLIFYITILQPLAWIPSHTMRDVFGAFIIILSIALIFFSVTSLQKILFGLVSVFLVFQHRSVYSLSALGTIILQNRFFNTGYKRSLTSFSIALGIAGMIFFLLVSELGQMLILLLMQSQENSMLSGAANSRNANIIEHTIKLIIGPFPWTQYFDGSVTGYSAFYSSTIILQAAWHLSIFYFLVRKLKTILRSEELRHYFYIIILFAIPAMFSLGGMNLYLLPSSMLAIALMPMISGRKILIVFITTVSLYIFASALFFFFTSL